MRYTQEQIDAVLEKKREELTAQEKEILDDFFVNDYETDPDIIVCRLANGTRTPQNDYERRVLQQIKDIKARGKGIELAFN